MSIVTVIEDSKAAADPGQAVLAMVAGIVAHLKAAAPDPNRVHALANELQANASGFAAVVHPTPVADTLPPEAPTTTETPDALHGIPHRAELLEAEARMEKAIADVKAELEKAATGG